MNVSLPLDFVEELRVTLGDLQAEELIRALDTEPVVGVRLNPKKSLNPEKYIHHNSERCVSPNSEKFICLNPGESVSAPAEACSVKWCDRGCVLPVRPRFTLLPEWHAGCLYVQEPASMIMSEVVKNLVARIGRNDIRYLDLCAAPGGKTTAALAALPEESFVVANEYVPARAKILVENLTKWGYPNFAVTNGDTSAYRHLKEVFDIVAVDAPCSGEGMMRKDEEARRQWSPALVRQCAALQREILDNAWQALRPGGYLIFSTCTFNRHEDEDMLRYAMEEFGAENIDTGLNAKYDIPGAVEPGLYALRFMPHRTVGEGLFLTVIQKPREYTEPSKTKVKGKSQKRNDKKHSLQPKGLDAMLINGDRYSYSQTRDEQWRAIPAAYTNLVDTLEKETKLIAAGVTLGQMKGKNFIPDASLALSTALNPAAFPKAEVDRATALNYLRRENITLGAETPTGINLVSYAGHPLGFVKHLGNRTNNLYPAQWRIRFL